MRTLYKALPGDDVQSIRLRQSKGKKPNVLLGAIDAAFESVGIPNVKGIIGQQTVKTLCGRRVKVHQIAPYPSPEIGCDTCLRIAQKRKADDAALAKELAPQLAQLEAKSNEFNRRGHGE